ncbi:hypothetical protein L6164_026809 [Bauhinia variegata]|uniref:Uncharacterized protein n=1 Tax=Bauhinia variegata TaxID=167791 RepID=A0ACB9LQY0_BAUVA|nr:hypothetical protein L6164_026809 [Bauhinia variegata]
MWQSQEQLGEESNLELTELRQGCLSQNIDYETIESLLPDPASQTMFYKIIAQIGKPEQIIPPPPSPGQPPPPPGYWLHLSVLPYIEGSGSGSAHDLAIGVIVRDSNSRVYATFCERWRQTGNNLDAEVDIFGAILSYCLTNGFHPLSAASENDHVVETFTNIRVFHPLDQFDLEIVHVPSDANRTAQKIAMMAPYRDNSLWNTMEIAYFFGPHVPFV